MDGVNSTFLPSVLTSDNLDKQQNIDAIEKVTQFLTQNPRQILSKSQYAIQFSQLYNRIKVFSWILSNDVKKIYQTLYVYYPDLFSDESNKNFHARKGIDSLVKKCEKFINHHLTLENASYFSEFSFQNNFPGLIWNLVRFAKKELKTIHVDQTRKVLTESENFIDCLKTLEDEETQIKFGIQEGHINIFTFSVFPLNNLARLINFLARTFFISITVKSEITSKNVTNLLLSCPSIKELKIHCLNFKYQSEIKNLKSFGNIAPFLSTFEEVDLYIDSFWPNNKETKAVLTCLDLRNVKNVDDEYLEKISKKIPFLKEFSVKSQLITKIPFAHQIEKINCCGCLNLIQLIVPQAIRINCSGCENLNTLLAPVAEKIDCSKCVSLTTFSTPQARSIFCSYCILLKKIWAPLATFLDCEYCVKVEKIFIPEATFINCVACINLHLLSAPQALELDCFDCKKLLILFAPLAKEVDCHGCAKLTTILAISACFLNCQDCKSLLTLSLPKVKKLNCKSCSHLKILSAPNVQSICYRNCVGLQTLKIPSDVELIR